VKIVVLAAALALAGCTGLTGQINLPDDGGVVTIEDGKVTVDDVVVDLPVDEDAP
jgi:predicted small lipoprotein YifL